MTRRSWREIDATTRNHVTAGTIVDDNVSRTDIEIVIILELNVLL